MPATGSPPFGGGPWPPEVPTSASMRSTRNRADAVNVKLSAKRDVDSVRDFLERRRVWRYVAVGSVAFTIVIVIVAIVLAVTA